MLVRFAVVLGEDAVDLAAGPLQELLGRQHLLVRAGVGDLHDAAAEPGGLGEQAGHLPGFLLGR